MVEEKQFGGLDYFRIAAAFLVAAIHTSPLASFSAEADFIFTRVLARTAVPFFFMTTGYFLLPQYLFGHSMDMRPLVRSLKKLFFLYLAAILLYLPINLYAGQFRETGIADFLRMIFLDGTFYHLWYLPAALWGIVFVLAIAGIRRPGGEMPFGGVAGISLILYAAGLFGDSYYGLIKQEALLKKGYDILFSVSTYTRNGFFYAPLFLVMGAGFFRKKQAGNAVGKRKEIKTLVMNFAGFILLLGLMTAEGCALHSRHLQRHDSMYIILPPAMCLLFRILLSVRCMPVKRLREISLWIYILHPLCIILVRGMAKAAALEELFVENSLLHYLAVCALSLAAAVIAAISVHTASERIFVLKKRDWEFARGRSWIELSKKNLARNVETLQGMLLEGQQLMPIVKADAYGHGAALLAGELQKMGIHAFGVACISEGISLRKNGITGDILILGYTHPKEFPLLRKYRLTQTVIDDAYGKALNRYGKKLKVHLKVDTGMRRLGIRTEKEKEISRMFCRKNLAVEGIYTHLCADETKDARDAAFTKKQGELFREITDKLEKQGISGLKTHLLASYGLFNYPELGGDYVRAGIALYGLLSDSKGASCVSMETAQEEENAAGKTVQSRSDIAGLAPVLSLKARIALVKDIYPGESVGYGLTYTAQTAGKIAALSIGYADGLPRSLSCGKGRVLIHGQNAPIIGRICMDQTMVDITGIPDVKAGEIAVLLGRCGGEEITAYEWAEKAGTITNEILSRLGARLPRVLV